MHGETAKHRLRSYERGDTLETDYYKLVDIFKQIVAETTAAMVFSDIEIGEVVGESPLQIRLDPQTVIQGDDIVLTKNTSEWTMEMSVDHITENRAGGGGYAEFASHNHEYKGRKKYLVHNQLLIGDKVILLRESGGQRYIALDRYYNPNVGCTTK